MARKASLRFAIDESCSWGDTPARGASQCPLPLLRALCAPRTYCLRCLRPRVCLAGSYKQLPVCLCPVLARVSLAARASVVGGSGLPLGAWSAWMSSVTRDIAYLAVCVLTVSPACAVYHIDHLMAHMGRRQWLRCAWASPCAPVRCPATPRGMADACEWRRRVAVAVVSNGPKCPNVGLRVYECVRLILLFIACVYTVVITIFVLYQTTIYTIGTSLPRPTFRTLIVS